MYYIPVSSSIYYGSNPFVNWYKIPIYTNTLWAMDAEQCTELDIIPSYGIHACIGGGCQLTQLKSSVKASSVSLFKSIQGNESM